MPLVLAVVIALVVIALVVIARAGREDNRAVTTLAPTAPTDASPRAASSVPVATVYLAAPGDVGGQPRTIVELGVRRGRIRWIAASRVPTRCSDGTSSSRTLLYSDEGTPSGAGGTLRYRTDSVRLTFRPGARTGTLQYERQGLEALCTSEVLRFRAERAAQPRLAQGLLDADRRAAERFR